MRFVHISDFHLFVGNNRPPLIRPDIVPVAEKIFASIARFPAKLDAIFFTGDLAGNAVLEDYEKLLELMESLNLSVFAIPGNHDAREPFRKAFAKTLPFVDNRFLQYETWVGPVRVLGVDTMVDGEVPEGELCAERLEWIAEKLNSGFTGITYLLMHHPPYKSGISFLDGISLVRGGEQFADIIRTGQGDIRIVCGHIHRPSMTCWNGVFAMVGGSPAFTIEMDFSGSLDEPPLEDAPYAYYVHALDEAGGFAVSPEYVTLPPFPVNG